jgi:hypothetical protein
MKAAVLHSPTRIEGSVWSGGSAYINRDLYGSSLSEIY